MRVFLDPGHGHGTGATARTSLGNLLIEDTLNYQVSYYLEQELERAGHEVMVSRTAESNPTKAQRALDALDFHAQAVICIHHNMAPSVAAAIAYAKTEIYYRPPCFLVPDEGHPGLNTPMNRVRVYSTEPSQDDAKEWMNRVRNVMRPYLRQGLTNTVLVECAYLDAPEHQKILNQSTYPARMGKALADWIVTKIKQEEFKNV